MASVSRTFSVLALGESAARLVSFAATVLIARRLGVAAFGILSVAAAVRLYLVCVVEGGIDSIGLREAAAQREFARELAPALLVVRLGVAILLILVAAVAGLLLLPQPDGGLITLYSLTLLPLAANLRWLHVGRGAAAGPALARLVGESLCFLVVFFALHEPSDLVRVPLAQFIGDGAGALLLALLVGAALGPLPIGRAWKTARGVLLESRSLVLHALLGLVIFNADLLLLRLLRGPVEAGEYAAAYTIIGFLVYLGVVYYQSLLAVLSRSADRTGRGTAYALSLHQVLLVGAPVAVGGALVASRLLPFVFGAAYGPAALPFAILAISVPASWLRNVAQAGQVAERRSELLLRTSLVAVMLNLGLNLVLIPRYGAAGAAVATLATELIRTLIALWYSRSLGYSLPTATQAWRPVLGVLVLAGGLLAWGSLPVWLAIPFGAALYAAVALPAGGLRVLRGHTAASSS